MLRHHASGSCMMFKFPVPFRTAPVEESMQNILLFS
jgi:hypothetical protein